MIEDFIHFFLDFLDRVIILVWVNLFFFFPILLQYFIDGRY